VAITSFSVPEISLVDLLGPQDRLIRTLESELPGVKIQNRGHEFSIEGEPDQIAQAKTMVMELVSMIQLGLQPDERAVVEGLKMGKTQHSPSKVLGTGAITTPGKVVRAKTLGQKEYLEAIDLNTITFGIGPAGTGKTYLAVAKAVAALYGRQVSRIILTRPAVEAGERLGFLPGTLSEKIDPYLRPLFDALQEMLEPEATARLIQSGVIEVAPLAYMRGRTLNDAFVILDEAQNTTGEQMKMFLTRLGFGSKMVITGDVTQIDLPGGKSGLNLATTVLKNIEGLHVARLTSKDVVRHELVTKIVEAYDRAGEK
jgi:phosphate starvation-inducible protein PhoH and related proteins